MKKISVLILVCSLLTVSNNLRGQESKPAVMSVGVIPIVARGHIYIQGSADNVEGNFVFDTGASGLYYDTTFYSNNDFEYTKLANAKLPGAGSTPQDVILILDTVDFSFGEQHVYKTTGVPVLKLKPILGDFADGIIGLNYFSESVLEIDYINGFIKVHESVESIDVTGYKTITLRKTKNRLYLPLAIQINDTLTVEGDFTLDFGSGGSLSLTSPVAQKYNLDSVINDKVLYYSKYGGVGGESASYSFMAGGVQMSDFKFSNVTMDYSTDKSGALASAKSLGLLGNDILQRFDILIDFSNNILYLKPNEMYNEEFTFSRLGFSYADRSQTLGGWIVKGLYKNRLPEKNGLEIDDIIISVNGKNVWEIPYQSQRDFFEALDEVNLLVQRGSVKKNISFKLESVL